MKKLLDLCIGVIRDASLYRTNNNARLKADAEYKAVRPRVMSDQQYKCRFCGYTSQKFNQCHHLDGNHAHNEASNFAVADALCHAYHHLGQTGSQDQFAPENMGAKTVVAAVPEMTAADLNLLQRAIGVALLDPEEADTARELHDILFKRAVPVQEAFGSFRTGDFAGAMAKLDDEEFANRPHVVGDLRLIFREDVLKNEGRHFLEDFTSLPFKSWDAIQNAHNKTAV